MIVRWIPGIACCVALAGCAAWKEAEQRADTLAAEADRHRGTLNARQRGGVVEVDQPYYGGRSPTQAQTAATELDRGQPLPEDLEEDLGVDITASPTGITGIQEILAAATELDVVVRTTYPVSGGIIDVPISGTTSINYRGPLSGLLDRLSAKFDLAWSYDGAAIRFDRMVSVIHDVPLPATAGKIGTEVGGVQTGASSVTTSKTVEIDPWAELDAALAQVIAHPATVNLAKNAGKVAVFGPPSVQRTAAAVIDRFAEVYSQRIGLEIATYFIDSTDKDDFALGTFLQGVFGDETISLGQGLLETGSVGNVAIVGGQWDGSAINFRALASKSNVVDYRHSTTIGQNGVVAPVSLLSTQNYVRESTAETADDGSVKLSLEVDTIDTGLSIFALPRIVDGGQIQLSLWILEASLNSLQNFGTIQLPKTDHRAIDYTVLLAPGETLVIGGYEQETVRRDQEGTGVAEFFGLGGSARAEVITTSMVVLVRPTVIGS
ncbi:MAG: secretion protein [Rhodobacteraceae bacterium]|nr:secretion protein [Paracoccaceae bacterium]